MCYSSLVKNVKKMICIKIKVQKVLGQASKMQLTVCLVSPLPDDGPGGAKNSCIQTHAPSKTCVYFASLELSEEPN